MRRTPGLMLVLLIALLVPALARAQTAHEVVEIPKLTNITIDGDARDWGDRGYLIDVLNPTMRERPKTQDLDARARLAWNETGLLVFVAVTDDVSNEGTTTPDTLRSRDSVEIVFADRRSGKESAQLVFAPGGTKQNEKLRQKINDRRSAALKAKPFTVEAASRRTATGYEMELQIPWSNLGLAPTVGLEAALQLCVHDADADARTKTLAWYPIDEPVWDGSLVQPIRLGMNASATPAATVTVRDDRLRRLMLQVGTRNMKAQTVQVFDGNHFIAESALASTGDLNGACVLVPFPPLAAPAANWSVKIDGNEVARVSVPSFDKQRIASAEQIELKFRDYVFSGDNFPGCGFENSERAENLLGESTVKRRYFDAEFNEVQKPNKPGRYGAVVEITSPGADPIRHYVTLYKTTARFDEATWRPKMHVPLPPEMGLAPEASDSPEIAELVRGGWGDGLFDKQMSAPILAGLAEAQAEKNPQPNVSVWVRNARWWQTLREKIGQPLKYPYLTWLPKDASEAKDKKFPTILFLHGSGERGRDLNMIESAGPRGYAKSHADFPFIVLSPLCPNGEWWNAVALDDLLKETMAKYPIDPDRLYITGLSMGGFGTWDLITLYPNRFAAAAPVCGGGDFERVAGLADLPIWVWHGGKDTTVSPVYSYRFVEELRKVNGRVKFTFYPELGHNVWTPTYNDSRLYDWFLEQKRGEPKEPKSSAAGTQPTEVK